MAFVCAVGAETSAGSAAAAPAAVTMARRSASARWAERLCRDMVGFQAAALDTRDGLRTVAYGPAPTDAVARRAALAPVRDGVTKVRNRLRALDRTLTSAPPDGRGVHGDAAMATALRMAGAPVAEQYSTAAREVSRLTRTAPARVPRSAEQLLRRLDRGLVRATPAITRTEEVVRQSTAGPAMEGIPVCRAIGPEWRAVPLRTDSGPTPAASTVTPDMPGAADLTAPALLLPRRYRPTTEVAALAEQTRMTGLARTYFYGATPEVETGSEFVADCPSAERANVQILGCYALGRISLLGVTRPEIASIVAVTAAHEMLHAAYAATPPGERTPLDDLLGEAYAATTDPRLRAIVGEYEQFEPDSIANELHSLVPTQVGALPPELVTYYARFFRDRAPVLAAYESYRSVFDTLLARYDGLYAQLMDLNAQISALRSQADATAREAQQLAGQIDGLRAQGRLAEANGLVASQNDAVRRAQSLNAQANALIGQYTVLYDQANAVIAQLGGLRGSLRPLG